MPRRTRHVRTNSPIEAALASAITKTLAREDRDLVLSSQVPIGPYRADFTLGDKAGPVLVIECDGHEFHERTKDQASRDRRRDREILDMVGLITVRFTGREIWQDAEDCADYCVAMAYELSYRRSLENVGLRVVLGGDERDAA